MQAARGCRHRGLGFVLVLQTASVLPHGSGRGHEKLLFATRFGKQFSNSCLLIRNRLVPVENLACYSSTSSSGVVKVCKFPSSYRLAILNTYSQTPSCHHKRCGCLSDSKSKSIRKQHTTCIFVQGATTICRNLQQKPQV